MKYISEAVERYREQILAAERYIWQNPETGYKEYKTSQYLAEQFEALGYALTYAEGITGFYTTVDTGREGPEVLVLAELDSVICPAHKDADPETGAVHACGHHAQCAALLGIAAALRDEAVLEGLSGKIRLCAVPAEELLEIEYRTKLRADGKIKYFGGKTEFLSRGYFDGVSLALLVHVATAFAIERGNVGCLVKSIVYKGKAAHAGGAPWDGKNALYAANCGLNAVNAIRETFCETDTIRVHPIITHGGDMVNAIPETVRLESYVRGKSFEAIEKASSKVNRALTGAALSLGTGIEITDIPGYAPFHSDDGLYRLATEAAGLALPDVPFHALDRFSSGSTDLGELSCVMPVVQPYCGGARGASHGADYELYDPVSATVTSAKWQLCILKLLLSDGARRAKEIVDAYKPLFASKEKFFAYLDSFFSQGERISYHENGTATVRID